MKSQIIRFGPFELDAGAYALTNAGRAVHVERLPMELLLLLARSDGRLVSRDEIIENLWGSQVCIDVDNAINTAVRKIRRTLAEHPENPRYLQTVVGKGYRLKTDALVTPAVHPDPGRTMLVVLPFRNLCDDADQDYFVDGLTEETIARLGQLAPPRLGVIARTTSMAYRETDKTVTRIGAELGVDYALEGGVRLGDGAVRVTAQLIRVSDQSQVWTQSYERNFDRILEIQAEMGAAIAKQVRLRLADGHRPRGYPTARGGAYDDYLRGLHHQAKVTRAELDKAIACFRRAAAAEPAFAEAYGALAHCFIRLPISSDVAAQEAFPQARWAVDRALQLDPGSVEALAADAAIRFWFDWDFAGAIDTARRALERNRDYAPASLCLAHVCSNLGDHATALAEIRRTLVIDPLSLLANTMYGQFLYHAGKDLEALEQFESTLELEPRFWVAHICRAKVCERLGRHDDALAACDAASAGSGGNSEALSIAGYVLARAGDRGEAGRKLDQLRDLGGRRYVPPYNIALVSAGLGDVPGALDALERALRDRDVHMVFLRDHKWDSLRTEPRFRAIVDAVGLS